MQLLVVVQQLSMLSLSMSFFSTVWTGGQETLTKKSLIIKNKEELNLKGMRLFSENAPSP